MEFSSPKQHKQNFMQISDGRDKKNFVFGDLRWNDPVAKQQF